MAAAASAIRQLGGETSPIPVEIASHTPLMRPAAEAFRQVLDAAAFKDPQIPVMSGAGAELVNLPQQARAQLLRQLTDSIRWSDCMDACAEQGVTVALELGPGAALSRMLHARHPHIVCRSLHDFRSLGGLAGWLNTVCHD
jgi:[acyl-carrier-protein] S-malonyltransferase